MHEHPTGGIAPVDSSMLVAIPRYVPDADAPYAITRRLLDALAPGSHLVLSHPAADIGAEAVAASMRVYNERACRPHRRDAPGDGPAPACPCGAVSAAKPERRTGRLAHLVAPAPSLG